LANKFNEILIRILLFKKSDNFQLVSSKKRIAFSYSRIFMNVHCKAVFEMKTINYCRNNKVSNKDETAILFNYPF